MTREAQGDGGREWAVCGHVAESVDALDLGSSGATHPSSSLGVPMGLRPEGETLFLHRYPETTAWWLDGVAVVRYTPRVRPGRR
jgi:hypothetical protein